MCIRSGSDGHDVVITSSKDENIPHHAIACLSFSPYLSFDTTAFYPTFIGQATVVRVESSVATTTVMGACKNEQEVETPLFNSY